MGEHRPITPEERSGVLHPVNLARYGARWFAPDAAIADVVDHYWYVTWNLEPDEEIDQVIIAAPAVTLSIEYGEVPGAFVVTGVHRGAWSRRISGRGEVFGIRLRPAGLTVCTDLIPDSIADATVPLTPDVDARLLTCLFEAGFSGFADRFSASFVLVVGSDISDAGVEPHGVVVLADDGEFGAQGGGVLDGEQVGVFDLDVTVEALDPGLVGGGAWPSEVLGDHTNRQKLPCRS